MKVEGTVVHGLCLPSPSNVSGTLRSFLESSFLKLKLWFQLHRPQCWYYYQNLKFWNSHWVKTFTYFTIFRIKTKLCTQGFLTVITLQIDATIGWSNLEFISFWPIIDSNTLLLVIKSWTDILDITLEVPEEIIGGAAVVKFQNKV